MPNVDHVGCYDIISNHNHNSVSSNHIIPYRGTLGVSTVLCNVELVFSS